MLNTKVNLIAALLTILLSACSSKQQKKFEVITFDDTNVPSNLERINDKVVAKWSDKLDTTYFEYFKYRQLEGNFKASVIRVTGDDYFALRLLTFDDREHLIQDYLIAGGPCGGPTELEDKIEFCPIRTSKMISPTTLLIKSVQQYYKDWNDSIPMQTDSTQWKIEISSKGKILELR